MTIKEFRTACPVPGMGDVRVEECWRCQYRDKNHAYNYDGNIHCDYKEAEG